MSREVRVARMTRGVWACVVACAWGALACDVARSAREGSWRMSRAHGERAVMCRQR